MPEEIYKALKRLDLREWNHTKIKEYEEDLLRGNIYTTTLSVERQEGKEEGKQEGKQEANEITARAMMADRMPIRSVSKYTGWSLEVIEALRFPENNNIRLTNVKIIKIVISA